MSPNDRRQSKDLVVFDPVRDWKCGTCGQSEGFLFMEGDTPLCLSCADLDELVWLPRGDTALTRRSRKYSKLSAVVVRFSRARKRYERQGVLVEQEALERAEAECLEDADARARQRGRAGERRAREDEGLVQRMSDAILGVFPSCPPSEAEAIARHTAVRGSGRVGRSAAGQALDEGALTLAVAAYVRHRKTPYDELLMSGEDRSTARERVRDAVRAVLDDWRRPSP